MTSPPVGDNPQNTYRPHNNQAHRDRCAGVDLHHINQDWHRQYRATAANQTQTNPDRDREHMTNNHQHNQSLWNVCSYPEKSPPQREGSQVLLIPGHPRQDQGHAAGIANTGKDQTRPDKATEEQPGRAYEGS